MDRLLTLAALLYGLIQFILMLPFKQPTKDKIVILAVVIFAALLLIFFNIIHLNILNFQKKELLNDFILTLPLSIRNVVSGS
jgi:fatty acid desaturase